MPKIGHLCFPIAFFGHFQYTRTDQERIPHSPSGGDFHGKRKQEIDPKLLLRRKLMTATKDGKNSNILF